MQFTKSAFDAPPESIDILLPQVEVPNIKKLNFKSAEALYSSYYKLKGEDNWAGVRSAEDFELRSTEYAFGNRMSYFPKQNESYRNLQVSRSGFEILEAGFLKSVEKFVANSSRLDAADQLRISEISAICQKFDSNFQDFLNQSSSEEKAALITAFMRPDIKFAQLGFRNMNLVNYYARNGYGEALGLTINELVIEVCNELGGAAEFIDMNSTDEIDLQDVDLLVAYHALECAPDPLSFLKRLKNGLRPGTKFHAEVTIEPGTPRLRYAHVYPFELGDLHAMLLEAGFLPISLSNIPHPGGPQIERIFSIVK